mmetsp:Transcript_20221/g.45850  ORF Transcript_20221/g.45850 Transcript_20221/m.45850 type:complete len:81 (+) Transcript_20221:264-506(+)
MPDLRKINLVALIIFTKLYVDLIIVVAAKDKEKDNDKSDTFQTNNPSVSCKLPLNNEAFESMLLANLRVYRFLDHFGSIH